MAAAGDEGVHRVGRRAAAVPLVDGGGELAQAAVLGDGAAKPVGEAAQRLIDPRQAGRPQEQERRERRAREIGGLVERRRGLAAAC